MENGKKKKKYSWLIAWIISYKFRHDDLQIPSGLAAVLKAVVTVQKLITSLGAVDSSESDGVLVKVAGQEGLNSSASPSSSPSFRLSGTASAAPSPFILEETQ